MLQMHLGMSYTELQKLPVRYRHWYIRRLSKHFDKKNENKQRSDSKILNGDNNTPLSRIEEIFNKKME